MKLLRTRWLRRLFNSQAQHASTEEGERPAVAPTRPLDGWWSQELSITQEQAAAVSRYIGNCHEKGPLGIKLMMLGEHGVGKRCVCHRLYLNSFLVMEGFDPTDSGQFSLDVVIEGKGVVYDGECGSPNVQWAATDYPLGDLSKYLTMRHCETCVFVYDVHNRASFEAVKTYHRNFLLERTLEKPSCLLQCSPSCMPRPSYQGVMFVIANKTDYDEKDWVVTAQEGEAFSATIGATFIPMSAKTGDGTSRDLLAKMTKLILLRRIHYLSSSQQEPSPEASTSVPSKILSHDYGQFWY